MTIERQLVFARDPLDPENGNPLRAAALRGEYGACIKGTIVYFGAVDANLDLGAFEENSVPIIEDWIENVQPGEEFSVVVGIEPIQPDDPKAEKLTYEHCFDYVLQNLGMIDLLGARLKQSMDTCAAKGATMRCVVRYASEMNKGPGNVYSGNPTAFKTTYLRVRQSLKNADARIQTAFSPGIGPFGIQDVDDYWPGKENVDLVGCTWYYNGHPATTPPTPFKASRADFLLQLTKKNLDTYFQSYGPRTERVCIDELGATRDKTDGAVSNEAAVENLRDHLLNLQLPDVALEHVNYFLASVWGRGVKLAFACQ